MEIPHLVTSDSEVYALIHDILHLMSMKLFNELEKGKFYVYCGSNTIQLVKCDGEYTEYDGACYGYWCTDIITGKYLSFPKEDHHEIEEMILSHFL